jgi:hypothetical protein
VAITGAGASGALLSKALATEVAALRKLELPLDHDTGRRFKPSLRTKFASGESPGGPRGGDGGPAVGGSVGGRGDWF